MSYRSPLNLADFTRGGQTTLHNLRMVSQVLRKILLVFLITFACFVYLFVKPKIPSLTYPFTLAQTAMEATLHVKLGDTHSAVEFQGRDGTRYRTLPLTFLHDRGVNAQLYFLKHQVVQIIIYSAGSALLVCGGCIGFLIFVGRRQRRHKLLRGSKLLPPKELSRQLKRKDLASTFTLGGIPLVKDSERAHFLIMGTPGTGKSVCMKELLDQIRTKKQRAIVYDKIGDFVSEYYRPEKDILLNPLDARCPPWNVWAECIDASDYDTLAASLMPLPLSTSDPFWIHAARTLFATTARKMAESSRPPTNRALLQYLLTADFTTLTELLRGTEAETLVSEKIEKLALSVRSVLATDLKSLVYLQDSDTPFSIRRWIEDKTKEDSWLFVSSRADKHESLKPLISTWINIAGTALMSLSPDVKRRFWMSLDELPTLHRLPYLSALFAESRKFGGCLIATMQSIAQLREVYGNHAAEAISGLCNTRVFFRTPETQTAEWVAKSLGEAEIDEAREGFSYGANTIRDGVSLQRHRITRPIVMPAEIMQLPDLKAYLRLPGAWPITQVAFTWQERKSSQPAFELRSEPAVTSPPNNISSAIPQTNNDETAEKNNETSPSKKQVLKKSQKEKSDDWSRTTY